MDQPGTRIQWGQALVVLSMIVLSWWTATQWTAWELAFQPELGRPWFMVLHRWPVYAPPLFFWWWYEFDAYAPAVFARGAWIAGSGGVLAFAAAVALSVHRAREAKRAATYGLPAGPKTWKSARRGCWARMASCWANTAGATSGMTVPSMS